MAGLMYPGGSGKIQCVLLENSAGRVASGSWSLSYSKAFSGYRGFVVVSTGLDSYSATENPSITCNASSGTKISADLRAICATDDGNRKYAGVFLFSNCNKKSTTISISSPPYFGHGYQIYGIK